MPIVTLFPSSFHTTYSGTGSVYTDYATNSDTLPTAVTADGVGDGVGDGSAGALGNFANFNNVADWNSLNGNVTTVGTNGGSSFYGTFDQSGNLWEWNDLDEEIDGFRGLRGGNYNGGEANLLSATRPTPLATDWESNSLGFRLASPVPEPSTCLMGMAGLACGAWGMFRRRRAR